MRNSTLTTIGKRAATALCPIIAFQIDLSSSAYRSSAFTAAVAERALDLLRIIGSPRHPAGLDTDGSRVQLNQHVRTVLCFGGVLAFRQQLSIHTGSDGHSACHCQLRPCAGSFHMHVRYAMLANLLLILHLGSHWQAGRAMTDTRRCTENKDVHTLQQADNLVPHIPRFSCCSGDLTVITTSH